MNNIDERLEMLEKTVNWLETELKKIKKEVAGKSQKDIRSNEVYNKLRDSLSAKMQFELRACNKVVDEILSQQE